MIDLKDKALKRAIGMKIHKIRLEKGMTLEEFGKIFGASKSNVRSWEIGKNLPNPERLKTIAKLADMTVEELLSPIVNFYTLQDKIKQYPKEPKLPIYESKGIDRLLDGLKWAMIIGNTQDEMLHIGTIAMILMQHCFKNGFEFEACLAIAIDELNKEAK